MDGQKQDVHRLYTNIQNLKELLRKLVAVSANLIDRNSQIDDGVCGDNLAPLPKFETLLEEFLSSCNSIELSLRTMQECLTLGKSSVQNLPIAVSNMKSDNLEGRIEPIEPNSTVSYNQYLSVVRYQVEMAKSIKSILDDFVNQQARLQQRQLEHQMHPQQHHQPSG